MKIEAQIDEAGASNANANLSEHPGFNRYFIEPGNDSYNAPQASFTGSLKDFVETDN